MAQVFGFLREDNATHGEKRVCKLLKENLPKEFSIYIECPLHGKRVLRYPDFIVVTNYGVIVLEIKDWIQVNQVNAYGAMIRTRGNRTRHEYNPVTQAREMAILLSSELRSIKTHFKQKDQQEIPWGYAVVLPNLPTSVITQLRSAWGDEFVLNCDDLDPPLINTRIKETLPKEKVRDLRKYELDFIRATINPTVLIEPPDRPAIILDPEQEIIITEAVKVELPTDKPGHPVAEQTVLFAEAETPDKQAADGILNYEAAISRNTSIRLVRGIAGSGKSLVLTQRARYLAAQYPEWRIAVVTFNDKLCQYLAGNLKGIPNLKPLTFHSLCSSLLRQKGSWVQPTDARGWLESHKHDNAVIQQYGPKFLEDEFKWIKEVGLTDGETYLNVERKGRGQAGRLRQSTRQQVYAVFEAYQTYLDQEGIPDWADIPHQVLSGLEAGEITSPAYNAILIDEAQDFAPVWIKVITRLLNPQQGVLFLADDPAQSIYRFYSWKEKGIHVVGRTRWLKVPYRNTYEIYQAAYQLIAADPILQDALASEGLLIVPDLEDNAMRHGPKPLVQRFASAEVEANTIRDRINHLIQQGMDPSQIAVLHRRRTRGVHPLVEALHGLDITLDTFHATKGLEFEVVFLTQLQETLVKHGNDEQKSQERRLVYMAMTRARQQLFMSYYGKLPPKYSALRGYADFID